MHNSIIRNRFSEEILSNISSGSDIIISGFDGTDLNFSSEINLYINGILHFPSEYTSGSTSDSIKFYNKNIYSNDVITLDTFHLKGTSSCLNLVQDREIFIQEITSSISAGEDIEILGFNNSNIDFTSEINLFLNGVLYTSNEYSSGSTTSSITFTNDLQNINLLSLEFFNLNQTASCGIQIGSYLTKEIFFQEITSSLPYGSEIFFTGLNNNNYNFNGDTNLFINGILYSTSSYSTGSIINSLYLYEDLYEYDLITLETFKTTTLINFSGNILGESDLQLDRVIIVKYVGLKQESTLDICISHNGNITSGSIFNSYMFVGDFDTYENLTYVFNKNKSNSLNFKLPASTFDIEIYLNEYKNHKLFAKVTFDTTNYNGNLNIINNYNFIPGDKLLFVCNKSISLSSNYNDLTFGINMNFGVCK